MLFTILWSYWCFTCLSVTLILKGSWSFYWKVQGGLKGKHHSHILMKKKFFLLTELQEVDQFISEYSVYSSLWTQEMKKQVETTF